MCVINKQMKQYNLIRKLNNIEPQEIYYFNDLISSAEDGTWAFPFSINEISEMSSYLSSLFFILLQFVVKTHNMNIMAPKTRLK